jgi:methylenetetrahydrofolate dehydrogenase (NADP+)/methenyltetrahydrofolate cyclohydrolase
MKLLKGKIVAEKILGELRKKIAKRRIKPGLAVVLVGENKASDIYVSLKQRAAGRVDMDFWVLKFSARSAEKDILQAIKELNQDENINGIIVQLPLPKKFNTQKIISAIDSKKDADGFSGMNPVFPMAIWKLLESSGKELKNKKAVVIANSEIFGEMMVKVLKNKKIKAEYILSKNIKGQIPNIKSADIIVTAIGKPKFLKGTMLKKGAIVIDGGISKQEKRVLGDVDFGSISKVAGALSPVPGGVGPVTIACLLENVVRLSKKR